MPRLFLYYLIWHLLHSVFHKWHIPTCRLFLQGHLCCLGRHEGILSSDNLSILLYKRHCIAVRLNEGLKRQYRILSIGIYNLTYQEYSPCEFYSLFIYINIINRIFTFFKFCSRSKSSVGRSSDTFIRDLFCGILKPKEGEVGEYTWMLIGRDGF